MKNQSTELASRLRREALSDPWELPGDLLWQVAPGEYADAVRLDRANGYGRRPGTATRRLLSLATRALNAARFLEHRPALHDRLQEHVAKLCAAELPTLLARELVVLDYDPRSSTALVSSRGLVWLAYRTERGRPGARPRTLVPVGSGASLHTPTGARRSVA